MVDDIKKSPVVFSKTIPGSANCVGLIMIAHDTYGLIPGNGVGNITVTPDYTRPPIAVCVKNHTVTGGTQYECRYLGAGGVLDIKTAGQISVGDSLEEDRATAQAAIHGTDWCIGVALTSTSSGGGMVRVATCVPE